MSRVSCGRCGEGHLAGLLHFSFKLFNLLSLGESS